MMWWKNNVPIWMVHRKSVVLLICYWYTVNQHWMIGSHGWGLLVPMGKAKKEDQLTFPYRCLLATTYHFLLPVTTFLPIAFHIIPRNFTHALKSLCKAEITAMELEEKEILAALEAKRIREKELGHFDGVWGKLKPRLLMNSHFERWLSWYRRESLGLPLGELQDCWTQWIWVHRFCLWSKGIVNWMLPKTISVKTGFGAFCSWKPPTTATVVQPVPIALFTLALCCQASKKEEQELLVHKLRDNRFVNSPTFQQTVKCEHFPGLFWEISAFPIVDFVHFMTSSH